ncbi:EamA family transporter RarD [Telmatospirillum sp.]|uniref:EamA family transporter RarD n=1 Tax=Telmatospirillum sp. TaxID=2079197 RepID=UPI00284CF46F|nr:EamA family transporter RarD [Telmatospirillum sp.]MDR3438863.1 EamA family transporter RarD [Telmatospirillum sp.]
MAAIAAYVLWGLFPFYFKVFSSIPAFEVLGHRIVWSALFMVGLVLAGGKGRDLREVFTDRKRLLGLTASALSISANWVCYIWAVGNGHALEASLGYFIYPLCAVVLGAVFFKERVRGRQLAAVFLVCLGVAVLASGMGSVPWLVLSFPLTFGLYAVLRKVVAVDAMIGLAVETLVVTPLALAYLTTRPDGGALLTAQPLVQTLLVAAGPVTAIPLIFFAYGARRLKLSTLGLLQYLSPTLQMAVAVFAFGETFTIIHAITFVLIWAGLLLYSLPSRRLITG